jgi:amidase
LVTKEIFFFLIFSSKGHNLNRQLTHTYNQMLNEVDVLLMPTLPLVASLLPTATDSREEYVKRSFEMIGNTAPFDATGHPAMSIPCGMVDGIPVGLMLVGKHFDEARIYQVAHAYEQAVDWVSQ